MLEHETFMRRALELARSVWGTTHPNPMVGALIVEEGRIVAEGATAPDGGPHAERLALLARGKPPRPGATLYVTMEPCCTHGRTGACTEAIISSGIKRVVVGATDPNPAHAGRGFGVLRAAGVEVIEGVLARECSDLNLIFNHWITQGSPLLAAKAAVTLDGKIACRTGESKWITGDEARADVHRWRRLFPGIAVGAMTVLKDNPRLTARSVGEAEWSPWRFVFDGLLRTVVDKNPAQVFTDEFRDRTIVVTTQHGGLGYVRKLRDLGIKVWCLESATQRVSFADFRRKCAEEKISGVYFEGGSQLVSELVRARQLDYLFVYRAPVLLADDKAKSIFSGLRPEKVEQGVRLAEVRQEVFGEDGLTRGRVV
jgi:diaminohydroxyphosphoribosylaminopyrimidine deaminase/5-amino-6-(5-phosphoribosylamino)uracil reductase